MIYGIESYVVLRDIWGSSYRDVEAVARWMVDALVESAIRGAPSPRGRRRPPGASRSAP